jgi:hypothetical protein
LDQIQLVILVVYPPVLGLLAALPFKSILQVLPYDDLPFI